MKQKDIVLILAVVFVAGIFSLLVSKVLISSGSNRNQTAQIVDPISEQFEQPDERVFNDQAINPTKLIQIGDSTNPQPF